jgi:hypothetical protein
VFPSFLALPLKATTFTAHRLSTLTERKHKKVTVNRTKKNPKFALPTLFLKAFYAKRRKWVFMRSFRFFTG